jgi:hypothetical protein
MIKKINKVSERKRVVKKETKREKKKQTKVSRTLRYLESNKKF